MKKLIIGIFALVLFQSQSLKAESMYMGVDYLSSTIDTGVTNISSKLDEKDTGYSIFAGLPVDENLSIEVSYQDFGEASLSGVSGNQFKIDGTTYEFTKTASLTVGADSIAVAAKSKHQINDNVSIYGKIGLHNWESTFGVSVGTASADVKEDGTDILYGAGIEANFNNLVFRAGYSLYDFDGDDVTSINAGLAYKF